MSINGSMPTFGEMFPHRQSVEAGREEQRKAALLVCGRVQRSEARPLLDMLGIELHQIGSVSR